MKTELCAKLYRMGKGRNKGQKMRSERSRKRQTNAMSQNTRVLHSFNKYVIEQILYVRLDARCCQQHNSPAPRVHSLLRSADKQPEARQ